MPPPYPAASFLTPSRGYPAGVGRWSAREWPLLSVGTLVVAGLATVGTRVSYGRPGLYVVSAALLLGALLRLLLPARRAGLLAVRSRPVDVLVLGVTALAVGVLTASLPTP